MINHNQPLVSIIIPMYNAEKYIAETIESVVNQTYKNWELIVVDDCSTDSGRDIVREYIKKDKRIKLIESETNFGGPARPRNIGIDNAKGEYIAFLDADDVWLSEKLQIQIEILMYNREYDIIDANAYTIDKNSKKIDSLKIKKIYNILKYFMDDINILILSNYININTTLIRNKNIIKFEEDKNLIAIEDWFFWINNLMNGKKIYIYNKYLIHYRILDNSISNRSTDKQYRKIYYMYSILFLKEKVSLRMFIFSNIFNTLKIIYKKVKNYGKFNK